MSSLENVPFELRAEARWVCWRREERGGKTTKLPVCAATGRMAKITDPTTWATFGDAVAAVARWRCDGVGFVLGPDRAYTGLDLDHVLADGALDPAYRWVVDEAGTYTKVSPSGDGLHLIFRGSKPAGAERSRRGQPGGIVVEMYDHDRYFTVTGDVFEGHGAITENPLVVERAYRRWIEPEGTCGQRALKSDLPDGPDAPGAAVAAVEGAESSGDSELIERMCSSRNGGAIRTLLAGDCSAQGGDHSAADMALCSHLAFWCAGDAVRMDRISRASGLMRDKWDSRRGGITYGAQTIVRAVSVSARRRGTYRAASWERCGCGRLAGRMLGARGALRAVRRAATGGAAAPGGSPASSGVRPSRGLGRGCGAVGDPGRARGTRCHPPRPPNRGLDERSVSAVRAA